MADKHYETEVNRGDISMGWLERQLNDRWGDGWKLCHMMESQGNLVIVWERRGSG